MSEAIPRTRRLRSKKPVTGSRGIQTVRRSMLGAAAVIVLAMVSRLGMFRKDPGTGRTESDRRRVGDRPAGGVGRQRHESTIEAARLGPCRPRRGSIQPAPAPTDPASTRHHRPAPPRTDRRIRAPHEDRPGEPAVDLPPTADGPPDGWPADVGLPPGARSSTDPAADDAGGTLAFRASGSPTDLADFPVPGDVRLQGHPGRRRHRGRCRHGHLHPGRVDGPGDAGRG